MSLLADVTLLQYLSIKDEKAFTEIYNRYWKSLYAKAYCIVQNEDLAKDAVQDVFISLWQQKEFAQIHSLKIYLQQAVRYKALNFLRSQGLDKAFYDRLATITADILYDDPLLFKEQQVLVTEIMESLPDDCRNIFKLSREEQMTYREIAEKLGISVGSSKSNLSKAKMQLKKFLDKDNREAGICNL